MGVRAAVVPIIFVAAKKLWRGALKDWLCAGIVVASALLCLFTGISRILVILAGAIIGLAVQGVKHRGSA